MILSRTERWWDRVIALVKHAIKDPVRIPVSAETLNSALNQMRSSSDQSVALIAMKLHAKFAAIG